MSEQEIIYMWILHNMSISKYMDYAVIRLTNTLTSEPFLNEIFLHRRWFL